MYPCNLRIAVIHSIIDGLVWLTKWFNFPFTATQYRDDLYKIIGTVRTSRSTLCDTTVYGGYDDGVKVACARLRCLNSSRLLDIKI